MRIIREECARKMPKDAKLAPEGVWETVKSEVVASFNYQGDEKRTSAVTMRASVVHF